MAFNPNDFSSQGILAIKTNCMETMENAVIPVIDIPKLANPPVSTRLSTSAATKKGAITLNE